MANDPDDIYDDPQTIGGTNDDLTEPDELDDEQKRDPSQSIYLPEKNPDDPRGELDDIEGSADNDEDDREHPEDMDADASKPSGEQIADEQDGTET